MMKNLDNFGFLDKVIRISNSTVDVERRLQNLMQLFKRELNLSSAVLFNLDKDSGNLSLRAIDSSDKPPSLSLSPADHFVGIAARERKTVFAGKTEARSLPPEVAELFKDSGLVSAFPVMDDQVLYGVLVLSMNEGEGFIEDRVALLETIAREVAGTIRNSRLYTESKKRIAELSVLHEVSRAVGSTIELETVLNTVVNITCKVLQAEGCALNVLDLNNERLRISSESGRVPACCRFRTFHQTPENPMMISPEMISCMGRKEPYFGPTCGEDHCTDPEAVRGEKSTICLPLSFKGHYKGTLSVYNKLTGATGQPAEFHQEDLELITMMGAIISSSVENALSFQDVDDLARRNERLVKSLRSLYEISGAMMTTVKMDELLTIITRALTLEQGLGFDRALIMVMNEEEDHLLGAAYHEITQEERVRDSGRELAEILRSVNQEPLPWSGQENVFLKLKLPLEKEAGTLVRTVLEKKPFIVKSEDGRHPAEDHLPENFGRLLFATAPMLAKGKVVGVIAVDRDLKGGETTPEDMRNLSLLANQAGLAVENSRLYEYIEQANLALSQTRERLIEAEKLAALGEMAAGMAHEIRNPLVSIGGFTRRLLKSLDDDAPQKVYVEVIINEVARLEKTLSEVLDFSRDTLGHLDKYNLNDVISDALHILRRDFKDGRVEIKTEYSDLPLVLIDERQIKHVLFNLFFNAIQAMSGGGELTVRTYRTTVDDRLFIGCDVSDTGSGIPPEILPNIFNPFFTTKDSGTGLGLSIVHKIITRHHGEIDVVNHRNSGATFTFKLPAAAESGHYLK